MRTLNVFVDMRVNSKTSTSAVDMRVNSADGEERANITNYIGTQDWPRLFIVWLVLACFRRLRLWAFLHSCFTLMHKSMSRLFARYTDNEIPWEGQLCAQVLDFHAMRTHFHRRKRPQRLCVSVMRWVSWNKSERLTKLLPCREECLLLRLGSRCCIASSGISRLARKPGTGTRSRSRSHWSHSQARAVVLLMMWKMRQTRWNEEDIR